MERKQGTVTPIPVNTADQGTCMHTYFSQVKMAMERECAEVKELHKNTMEQEQHDKRVNNY